MTGHPGWLCLGGVEIVNQDRAATYAANGWAPSGWELSGCDTCGPDFALALEENNGQYSNPGSDVAPWFSTTEPNSFDFGGLYVTSVDGLGPGVSTRSLTSRATGRGSFIGPEIQAAPEIVVTGLLFGRTSCAVAYGFRWLTMALKGSACANGCDGDDLTFLDCCPGLCDDAPGFVSYADCLDPHIRTLKGVQLIASPRVTTEYGDSCSCCTNSASLMQVTFTLAASQPCVYRDPVAVSTDVLFDLEDISPCVIWTLIDSDDDCLANNDPCAAPADCLADPFCPPPLAPPTAPAPSNPCICLPLQTVRSCTTIDPIDIPEWAEGDLIITIKAGSADLRQLSMTFIPNPLGQPVDDLDPCTACGEVTLSRIPAGASFVMDGTTRTVTIDCPGSGPTDAGSLLGSAGGQLPFRFPEIACGGTPYVLCVTADATSVAADASVSAAIAVREC
jgi:hypothetical protein